MRTSPRVRTARSLSNTTSAQRGPAQAGAPADTRARDWFRGSESTDYQEPTIANGVIDAGSIGKGLQVTVSGV
jgi:hypothetical protein